jgi:O-acetyl-ADP-ribose deacetylase
MGTEGLTGPQAMIPKVYFCQGDITALSVDAIVNAANTDLILGAGVAGAIRARGGPAIQEDCDRISPIQLGEAAATTGGNLPALCVIHAASMRLGGRTSAESLRESTRASLMLAEGKGLKSIAFPAVGTGVAGFPMDECARIMIGEVLEHLRSRGSLEQIYFVLYDDAALQTFEATYRELTSHTQEP